MPRHGLAGFPKSASQTWSTGLKTPPFSQIPGTACPRLHQKKPFRLFGSRTKVCGCIQLDRAISFFLSYIVRHSCARVVVSRWSQWDVAYKIDWMEFQSRVALTWERLPAIAPNKSISVVRIGQESVVRSTSANIRPNRSVAHGYTMTIERIELRSWIAFSVELSSSPAPNVTGAGPWVRYECLWRVTK